MMLRRGLIVGNSFYPRPRTFARLLAPALVEGSTEIIRPVLL